MTPFLSRRLSLRSRGARRHLAVAMILVAVLPLLSLLFIFLNARYERGPYAVWTETFVALAAFVLGFAGFLMLRRYPKDIETLRGHLNAMAEGRLPDKIRLRGDTDDAGAISDSLNRILDGMRNDMKQLEEQLAISERMQQTIREQEQSLRDAERRRVMIESLAAACHHIGQPATVLRLYLDAMAQKNADESSRQQIEECRQAIETIAGILDRLRRVSDYRTVPYPVSASDSDPENTRERILDI